MTRVEYLWDVRYCSLRTNLSLHAMRAHALTPQHTKQLRYSLVVFYVALRLGLPMASQATLLQCNS
jgi:hypothetical protein